MTKKEVPKMLQEMGLPFAYDHFAEGEKIDTPFMVYLYPRSNHFSADGVAFYKKESIQIEVYTDKKDMELEERIEAVLEKYGLFFSKSEVWISSEKLYEVLYETEV